MNDQERELDLMVAELEQESRLLRARNERLQAENKALEERVESSKVYNRNLFDALNAARGEISNLRARLDTHVAQNVGAVAEAYRLRTENTAPREKLNTPGKSREHLTDEIKHLQAENTKLRGWVWDAEQAAGRLQIEVREKKDAIRALHLRIATLEGEKK